MCLEALEAEATELQFSVHLGNATWNYFHGKPTVSTSAIMSEHAHRLTQDTHLEAKQKIPLCVQNLLAKPTRALPHRF